MPSEIKLTIFQSISSQNLVTFLFTGKFYFTGKLLKQFYRQIYC